MRKPFIVLMALVVSFLNVSCAGTRMRQTYVDASRVGKPIGNVLIVAVVDDDKIREIYETHLMKRLKAAGVKAESTTKILSVNVGEKLDREEIADLVAKNGSDTVAITFMVDCEESEAFSRIGRLSDGYNRGYYQYYTDAWDDVYAPAVSTDHVRFFVETRLYDVKSQTPVWSGISETIDPKTMGEAIGQVVTGIMDELGKNGLLPADK